MPTIKDYYKNDFNTVSLSLNIPFSYNQKNKTTKETFQHTVEIIIHIRIEKDSSSRFLTFFIPDTEATQFICTHLLNNLDEIKKNGEGVETIMGFTGDRTIGNIITNYSNRIFFYTERLLNEKELLQLEIIAKEKLLCITFRSTDYLKTKMDLEKPLAFISHDSRDKLLIAKPLSDSLHSRLCFTWYDEYSLKVGDSLRESIEKGIKDAKKCILVLTPNFLENPGWTKKEFNSIFSRELIFNEKVVLPIWFNVTKSDIYNYSPSLTDTFALTWPNEQEYTKTEDYKMDVEKVISKIHTAITH